MQVRHPQFDLSGSDAQWGDNLEAVNIVNGGGIVPTAIERYMIRVMRQARTQLDPAADADLIADIDVFNKQEGQHLKVHAALMALVRDTGYPRIVEFEAAFEADLRRFLATESLAWNLAYCEGFESMGAATAEAWIDGRIAEICGDHGSVPMQAWRWHLAEEFEHRSVVHDVLHRLYGDEEAFALRVAGADFARSHIAGHAAAAVAYLNEVNRASMTEAEVAASVEREMEAWLAVGAASGDALAWVNQPGYDPSTIAAPREYERTLARYDAA